MAGSYFARWAAVVALALSGTPGARAATADEVAVAIATFNRYATNPIPTLDDRDLGHLVGGDVVRLIHASESEDKASSAVGMMLTSTSRDALWIAAQDEHTQVDPGLTELRIESLGPDQALWYGYWDLPSPVRDRQWVVSSLNAHAVADRTDGMGWEHVWTLVDGGQERARPHVASGAVGAITVDQLESAIYTPVNEGSWFMLQMPDGSTLCGYQARSVVGGAVPTWLVTRLVLSRMESMLRDLDNRARSWSPAHYTAQHAPVYGGAGTPIPVF